ncbi:plasmid stabilization protein StbC (plasmid) [Enterobacter soli]|uniref:plasmid stabilization protein StbC n=1 Tax=Enterobacter TaxID=547 RepID=UPI00375434D9
MDKQPDKLDVLMDWFLGDAKEIVEAMKQVKVEQADMFQQLGELKSALELTADDSRAEIIGSLRDIQAAMKEENKARSDFLTRWQSLQHNNASTIVNRVVIMTAVCSIVGAAIGAALTLLILK